MLRSVRWLVRLGLIAPALAGFGSGCTCGSPTQNAPDAPAPPAAASSSVGPQLAPTDAESPLPNAAAAIDVVRPSLRACFIGQLKRRPVPLGTMTFELEVSPEGRVVSATPRVREGLDDETVTCMTEGVRLAIFERSADGAPTKIFAPFTFQTAGPPDAGADGGTRSDAGTRRDAGTGRLVRPDAG